MRKGVLFAILGTPPLVWPCAELWAESRVQAWRQAWTPLSEDLSLAVRLAYSFDQWAVRYAPIIILAVALIQPLIVLGMAALLRTSTSGNDATHKDVLAWWSVGVMIEVECLVLMRAVGTPPHVTPGLAISVFWVGLVALWISLATAYAIQSRRRLQHGSAWHPAWLLGLAWLGGLGWIFLPVLAFTVLRRGSEPAREAG